MSRVLTSAIGAEPTYADWNPHFTPAWLSDAVAQHIPRDFSGAIVDPACGAGNLLLSAIKRTRAHLRSDLSFVGCDTDPKAVRDCRAALTASMPKPMVHVCRADFMRTAVGSRRGGEKIVVMNPPFVGYDKLRVELRADLRLKTGVGGRFNLAHAFVFRALDVYRPRRLISILPSTWAFSSDKSFRERLETFGGNWDWIDIGGAAFQRVSVHVGVLIWRSKNLRASTSKQYLTKAARAVPEVRLGLATGNDAAFVDAGSYLPASDAFRAVRGRDIGRDTDRSMWLPATAARARLLLEVERSVRERLRMQLLSRSCVVSGRRKWWQPHEAWPEWFLGVPKVLLPEVCAGKIRAELDASGKRFPLHSVIAIRAASENDAERIVEFLNKPSTVKRLLELCPRLAGDAVRIKVWVLRELLAGRR